MKIDLTCPAELWRYDLPSEDKHACSLVMYNLSDKVITSMEVTLVLSDKEGDEVARQIFRAHDLRAPREKTFTFSIPVDEDARADQAEIIIEKIWFDDNSVWRRTKGGRTEYTSNALPNSRSLEMLRYAAGPTAVGFPQEQEGLWLCVCGRPNADYTDFCIRCHREKQQVFQQFNREAIEKTMKQREQQLSLKGKAAREDASRLQLQREAVYQAKKKASRRRIIVAVSVLVCLLAAYVGIFHVLPYVTYRNAVTDLEAGSWQKAEAVFADMGDYLDSEEYLRQCRYLMARDVMFSKDEKQVLSSRDALAALGDYQDAADLVNQADYHRAGLLLDAGRIDEASALYASLGDYKDSTGQVLLCAYLNADKLLDAGKYEEARAAFEALGDYGDAAVKVKQAVYLPGKEALERGELDAAFALLTQVEGFEDAGELIKQIHYQQGLALAEQGEMEAAGEQFLLAGNYRDAADQANECIYRPAQDAMDKGEYLEAAELFAKIPDYQDAAEKVNACLYAQALACLDDLEYTMALSCLEKLPADYQDVAAKKQECVYQPAKKAYDRKDYQAAIDGFSKIPGYRDADKQLNKARYRLADSFMDAKDYPAAMELYELLGDYSESKKQLRSARYLHANVLMEAGEYEAAQALYTLVDGYKDSADKLKEIRYIAADKLLSAGDYAAARPLFEELGKYSDARKKVTACDYKAAEAILAQGRLLEAAELFASLGDHEDARTRSAGAYYALAQETLQGGRNLQAAAYFLQAGEYQDAAQQAEALYDGYYQGIADDAHQAMDQGEYALAVRLLEEIDLTDLPKKYASLKDTYQEANYLEAERLDKAGLPYEALPYYRAVPAFRSAKDRLDRICYRILGAWQTHDGLVYIFREDGTCSLEGEELHFSIDTYTMSTGETPDAMKITHRISSVNKDQAMIYDLRNNTTRSIYLTRTELQQEAPMPQEGTEVVDE